MLKTMINGVKISNSINKILVIIILPLGMLFISCKNKDKMYLDYGEVQKHANLQLDNLKIGTSFALHNEKDTIYLNTLDRKISTASISDWETLNFTNIDKAIEKLSKITIDNLHLEKKKGEHELFIVVKDKKNKEIKFIEVGQTYIVSDHKNGYNTFPNK